MKNLAVLFLLLVPGLVISATSDFSRTLYVGMRGEDVRALQKFLNTDPETRVAESGAGSSGNETDYFGGATKRAIIKFQEKYREDILAPVGLTAGLGIFGPKTKEKISMLQKSVSKGVPINDVPNLTVEPGEVYVMFPSQYSGKSGTMISISGAGFTLLDNTVYFGPNNAVIKASSWNGQSITFKVPDIPKGLYPLYVTNARGESNKEQWFVVTDGVSPEPKIDKFSSDVVSRGGTVSIVGSGFTAKENTIMVGGVGLFKNVLSEDGKTLSFRVPENVFTATFSPSVKTPEFKIWVHVINENGVSNGNSFTLKL